MIARALYTLPYFKPELVQMIVTQSTPHQAPVIAIDHEIASFYERVNTYWRDNNKTLADVTVVSTGGGHRDVLVRSGLTSLEGVSKFNYLYFSESYPPVNLPIDG